MNMLQKNRLNLNKFLIMDFADATNCFAAISTITRYCKLSTTIEAANCLKNEISHGTMINFEEWFTSCLDIQILKIWSH